MKRLPALLLAALVVVGLLILLRAPHREAAPVRPAGAAAESPAATGPRPTAAVPGTTVPATPTGEDSNLARDLNSPTTSIEADVRLLGDILETFRSNFAATGNPVGTNAEITAALAGSNRLRLALIPRDHPAINRDGELCDRWGTPFFFHSESASRMEIRSAGPDRRMWTDDDVVHAP